MGLDVLTARDDRLPRSACRYQRLRGDCGSPSFGAGSVRVRRPLRLRRRASNTAGRWRTATSSGRRLRLLVFLVPAARRVAALLAELVRRLALAASDAADCPAIVFSSQWGLPVLSHSASSTGGRSARLRALYLERSLSTRSSSGAGSPC